MEYQNVDCISFLGFVGQMSKNLPTKSVGKYAATSFLSAIDRLENDVVDEALVKLWLVTMLISGKKSGTCTRYIRKMHSIYKDWQKESGIVKDPFIGLESLYDSSYESSLKEVYQNLNSLKSLFAKNGESEEWQLVGIFLYLLYIVNVSFADVVNLKFANGPTYCPQIDEIVAKQDTSNGREYVFDLNQSHARQPQIIRDLSNHLYEMLSEVGMKFGAKFSRNDISALWIAQAIKAGVGLQTIRNVLEEVPPQFKALTILDKKQLPEEERQSLICKVADSINNSTERWFVMKLRAGTTPDDIEKAIAEKFPDCSLRIELFYPTRTVYVKKGKTRVKKNVPIVPDLLFFRTRYDRVQKLFSKIGDLAWCYKWSNSPDSSYSIISQDDMRLFQQAIGEFTSDIRVELVDLATDYKVGDSVCVTGGVMSGFFGTIEEINDQTSNLTFILRISNEKGLRITHEVEGIFLEPSHGLAAIV